MTVFKFSNFGSTTLSAPLDGSSTEVFVLPSDAAQLPGPLDPDELFAAILRDGIQQEEIVHVTANPGTGTLTVLRGAEGTGAHSWGVGTLFEHTLTKDSIEWFTTGGNLDWKAEIEAALAAKQTQIDALIAALAANGAADAQDNLNVESSFEDANSQIQVLSSAVTDNSLAMANFQISMNSQYASFTAGINSQLTTIVSNAGAQATAITTLQSQMGAAQGQITSLLSVNSTQDSAIATLQSTLTANFNDHEGRIDSLETLRITDYNALASSVNTLNVSLGALSASVTATQTAVANINGNLTATYGFVLNAGGVVTSFEALAGTGPAGGNVSSVKWQANQFVINTAGGDKVPFTYDALNSTLTVQNLKVLGSLIYDSTVGTPQMATASMFAMVTNFAGSSVSIPAGGSVLANSAAITTTGGKVIIDFNVGCEPFIQADVALGANPMYILYAEVYRGGTLLGSITVNAGLYEPDTGSSNGCNLVVSGGLRGFRVTDLTAPAGAHTYVIYLNANPGVPMTSVNYRYLSVQEHKKS